MQVLGLQTEQLRALTAGLLYMLLYGLASHLAWGVRGWLQQRSSATAIRLRGWAGWALLLQMASLGLAVAYPFVMLLGGIYAANDVGVQPVDWRALWPTMLAITGGASLWLIVLWYGARGVGSEAEDRPVPAQARGDTGAPGREPNRGILADILLRALGHEAVAATCRGALMPVVGPYWGIWLAAVWSLCVARLNPALNAALQQPGRRHFARLDWALAWVGALLFAYSGSAWAALGGRALCQAVVLLLVQWLPRPGRPAGPRELADDQGQNHQGGKAASSQDSEAPQVA